jgi:chitodextrinase
MLAGCGAQVTLNIAPEMNARAGQPVRFDAFTPEAAKAKYSWDFGDGSKAQGATLQHTYLKSGEYSAKLKLKGDGKRGKADIKVKVGPPSALSVLPKETGFVVVVENLAEAKTAWDLLYKMPFLNDPMDEAKEESNNNLGFFFLEESELSSRGFDATLGGAFGVMTIEDQFVPLFVGGIKSDGKALAWVKGLLTKEGLTTKEEQIGGVSITHTYFRNREIGAMAATSNFLIYSPSVAVSKDYHVKALTAALNTANAGSVADNEWLYHTGVSGGAAMYLQGGDFLVELSREMESDRDLRPLASSLRSTAKSLKSISASVRTNKGNFETDLALWMTDEGIKNYQKLAPQVPLLNVAPSMASGAVFYMTGRLDPLEIARQALAGLSPADRDDLTSGISQAEGMLGVNFAEELGKPLGAANTMLVSIDSDGLASLLSSGVGMPVEFVWAYELEDTALFKSTLATIVNQASPFMAMTGYSLNTKKSGDAEIYSINVGFLEFAWAVKPGITLLTLGAGPGTIEKALELITPSTNQEKTNPGEQKIVVQFNQLRQELSEAQDQLKVTNQAEPSLAETIEALRSFQQLTSKVYSNGDTIHAKVTLELTK